MHRRTVGERELRRNGFYLIKTVCCNRPHAHHHGTGKWAGLDRINGGSEHWHSAVVFDMPERKPGPQNGMFKGK